jgi:UPF0716 family protein affecting phage T7 exclusion
MKVFHFTIAIVIAGELYWSKMYTKRSNWWYAQSGRSTKKNDPKEKLCKRWMAGIMLVLIMLPKGYFSTFYAMLCLFTIKRQLIVKKVAINNTRNSRKKFRRTILGSIIKTSTIVAFYNCTVY